MWDFSAYLEVEYLTSHVFVCVTEESWVYIIRLIRILVVYYPNFSLNTYLRILLGWYSSQMQLLYQKRVISYKKWLFGIIRQNSIQSQTLKIHHIFV